MGPGLWTRISDHYTRSGCSRIPIQGRDREGDTDAECQTGIHTGMRGKGPKWGRTTGAACSIERSVAT